MQNILPHYFNYSINKVIKLIKRQRKRRTIPKYSSSNQRKKCDIRHTKKMKQNNPKDYSKIGKSQLKSESPKTH